MSKTRISKKKAFLAFLDAALFLMMALILVVIFFKLLQPAGKYQTDDMFSFVKRPNIIKSFLSAVK